MICRTQADIYIQAQRDGYDIEPFSDAYLTSHFCSQRMDRPILAFRQSLRMHATYLPRNKRCSKARK